MENFQICMDDAAANDLVNRRGTLAACPFPTETSQGNPDMSASGVRAKTDFCTPAPDGFSENLYPHTLSANMRADINISSSDSA